MAELDPISFRILWGRLVGFVEEAGATLRHSAFSPMVSEGNDCTAVLFDATGRELAEPVSFTATSFIGTVPRTMKIFLRQVPPDRWRPGDILICNDPWIGTGHLFDICIACPIFYRGRLVAFSMTCSHTTNIGGGGRIDVRTVFEEGIRIPITWLQRGGEPQQAVYDIIAANVPGPEEVLGDIKAQVNANRGLERRVVELLDELGMGDLQAAADMIESTSRTAMASALTAIPTGSYVYDLKVDSLEHQVDIRCRLDAPGDQTVALDFAGTTGQVRSAINSPLHYTLARAFYALKAALLPHTPGNEASFSMVTVKAPEGCILNPTFPFPTAYRSAMGHFVPAAVMGALSRAVPERVLAEGAGPIWEIRVSGERSGRRFNTQMLFGTGQGGSAIREGMDAVMFPGNPANTPLEVLERNSPVIFKHKQLRRDSGGTGERRGGWGQRAAFEVVGEGEMVIVCNAARTEVPASGLAGGGAGSVGRLLFNSKPIAKGDRIIARAGDVLELETPGGGGYGRAEATSADSAQEEHVRMEIS